jgi:hypothetical protein
MAPMGNHTTRETSLPPSGYIRIEHAAQLVKLRMFSQEIPEAVLIAAKQNVEDASVSRAEKFEIKVKAHPTGRRLDLPLTTLTGAIGSGEIALFAMIENSARIFAISENADEVLARTGFPPTKSTIYTRFMKMVPITVLRDLECGELQRCGSKMFALILKEGEFEDWLGRIARQKRWPVDRKPPRSVGRPDRVSTVKPLVKLLVENGKWRGGNPFKQLTYSANAKLKGQEVSRGTIEKALKQLYAETGDLRYRHKKRKRRASPRKQKKRSQFLAN